MGPLVSEEQRADVLERVEALEDFERTGRCSAACGTLNRGGARLVLRARDQLLRTLRQETRAVQMAGAALEADEAVQLLKAAIADATSKKNGLPWRTQPLRLVPSDDLVRLVVKSQQLALAQGGEGGE